VGSVDRDSGFAVDRGAVAAAREFGAFVAGEGDDFIEFKNGSDARELIGSRIGGI